MKLRYNQKCPIHNGYTCCGREHRQKRKSKWQYVRPGVKRLRDEHSPDGWRYKLSKAELERVLLMKIRDQKGLCKICDEELKDIRDVVPDHISPKGMGGSWHDSRPENIQAVHFRCNMLKGSQRVA